jgi:hypothetical protein
MPTPNDIKFAIPPNKKNVIIAPGCDMQRGREVDLVCAVNVAINPRSKKWRPEH